MASDVKRAYSSCPDVAGFFDSRLGITYGLRFREASQRPAGMGAGEKTQDRNRSRIAGVLQFAVPSPGLGPADAPYPYQTVGPGPHEAGRDCDTNGGIVVLRD